ncbi:SDR family oxidoreductase [Halogeometricum borinquense]|uniref:SDR family oxidoreductase n=1 Tax=Halogeometricum borinquense TaxID=60847 RepID=UPI0034426FAE
MRILVTGATGTVGKPLVTRLLDTPVRVRVATTSPQTARERFGDPPEYVEFDFERPETWGSALEHTDRMFLLSPPAVGVTPVREFIDAADRVGVGHVAYLSILGAEKLPVLPHRRLEKHLVRANLAYTFLRASWFMQNLSGIHRPEITADDEIYIPAGDGRLGFIDASDVAAVVATVLTEPGYENRTLDLTGPESMDFDAVAAVFSDVLDRRITYADPSRFAFARHMYRRGVPTSMVVFMGIEYSIVRLGFSGRATDDVATVLDRPPRTVRQFVTDHAELFSEN